MVKTSPRDHQKWIQGVRITPRGFEKRAPRQFKQFEQNLLIFTIFFDFQCLAKTRPRDHQKWIQHVRFTPRGSEKRAPRQFKQFDDFDNFKAILTIVAWKSITCIA